MLPPLVPDVALPDVSPEVPLGELKVLFSELTEPPVVPVTPLDAELVVLLAELLFNEELVPVSELGVPEVEPPVVPETILNAPSIDTLAVF